MKLGKLEIEGAALAPMAGVADRAMREICREYGVAYTVSEMVSAKGLNMCDRKSKQLLLISDNERPCAAQLFGDDPAILAEAAKKALEFEPDAIDINMGCPAPKIASSGGGASLMKSPLLAAEITEAVVNAVEIPVTVKMRTGFDSEHINAVELARLCEAAGAAAITVHGRTKQQMYAPPVDLETIREVRRAVKIPVIANGDVTDGKSAKAMLDFTGCDLVMVGRGALGRPWVFEQINAYLTDETVLPEPPLEKRMDVMLRHIKKLCEYKGSHIGMLEARKHAAWYMKGIRGAAAYRQEIFSLESISQLEEIAARITAEAF